MHGLALAAVLFLATFVAGAAPPPTLTGWGGGQADNVVPRAAEVGFTAIVVHHENTANFARFIELGREHGIAVYAWLWLGDRPAWNKFVPDTEAPWQVMRPAEDEAFARLKADKTPGRHGYQGGGEPVNGTEVLLAPLLCFHDPRVPAMFHRQIDEMLAVPGVAGVALDYVGYQNYRDCLCPTSQALLAAFREAHPELPEDVARERFFRDSLVAFNNDLAAYVRQVKPDARVLTHVYPVYLPEPLYGNLLDVDECAQTAAWFFEPFWSTAKIEHYSRVIVTEANRYHARPLGAALIGIGKEPAKPPERVALELQAMLAGGCRHVHVCSLNCVLDDPATAAVFRHVFGKPGD